MVNPLIFVTWRKESIPRAIVLHLAIKLYCIHVKCSPKSCPAWVTKWQLWHVTGEQHDIQSETCITSRWVAAACLVHSIHQPAPVYDRQAMLMSTYLKNCCHTQSATDNKHHILARFSLPSWIQWVSWCALLNALELHLCSLQQLQNLTHCHTFWTVGLFLGVLQCKLKKNQK